MKTLTAAKAALYGIFLNYYCYYVLYGAFIPRGTVLFLAAALLFVGMDILRQRHLYLGSEITCWIVYAILSFFTTAILCAGSSDTSYISDIIKFVQRLLILSMVAYICEQEGSIRFGLQLMAVTAIACAVSILLVVDDIQLKLSLSTDANLSANDVGSIMAYGCFAVLFFLGKKDRASLLLSILKTSGIICLLIVIFLAGSRKSIIAVVIMVVLMILLCLRDYWSNQRFRQLFVVFLVGAAAFAFVYEFLLPYAQQTNLYARLFGRGAEIAQESDESRVSLYVFALQDFLERPIFGLGFNKFVAAHGNYSHSTYAEPLACSGIIGLLYLYPYVSILRKQLYLVRVNVRGSLERLKQKEIFVYLCMFLFIGIGIPYMYKDVPCILLGTFIASQNISFEELRRTGRTSVDY